MSFEFTKKVSFTEMVEFLVGSGPSSPLGSMLDKIRDGTTGIQSTGKNNAEYAMISNAHIIGCIRGLRDMEHINFEKCPNLRKFANKTNTSQGALCLAILGAYHQWYLKSEERGLVEVYRLLQKLDSKLEEPKHHEEELSMAFRLGKTKDAREISIKMLKDAFLVASAWLEEFNGKVDKKNRRMQ